MPEVEYLPRAAAYLTAGIIWGPLIALGLHTWWIGVLSAIGWVIVSEVWHRSWRAETEREAAWKERWRRAEAEWQKPPRRIDGWRDLA